MILRFIAIVSLFPIYFLSIIWSVLLKKIIKRRRQRGRIIINATFHNPNWFFAHIAPITQSGYGEVILVADEPVAEIQGLRYMCPPKLAAKIFSRAGAKAIWTFYAGLRYPADIFIGYHIFPSSVTALICARLFGAKAMYQVTYGEAELEGGGWKAENALLRALGKHSNLIEKYAVKFANEFDLVIVRGSNAKKFLRDNGCEATIEVVTGSVVAPEKVAEDRDIDVIFVGRMAESKRPLFLLELVALLTSEFPDLSVKLLGDGDQLQIAKDRAKELAIERNLEFMGKRKDVMALLGRSKLFILPSRWEGVSIALMESMISGAVPLVSNVGDMADFVKDEKTGFIFDLNSNADSYREKAAQLLADSKYRKNIQQQALKFVSERSERTLLTSRWLTILKALSVAPTK